MDPEKQLIPTGTDLRPRREDANLYWGIACFASAIVELWLWGRGQRDMFPSFVWLTSHPAGTRYALVAFGAASVLAVILPTTVALFMLWKAFLRGDFRDRALWAAAMVLTSQQVVALVLFGIGKLCSLPAHLDTWASLSVAGMIAYAAAFLIFYQDSALRNGRIVAVGCAAAMALMFVVLFAIGLMTWMTFAFAVGVSAGSWLVGTWLASRVGVNVYANET